MQAFLVANSPYFAAMVRNPHREREEGKATFEYSPEVGNAFVCYIYTRKLDTVKEPKTFLEMGERFDMPELKDLAEKEMLNSLNKDNMLEFFQAGDLFRYE